MTRTMTRRSLGAAAIGGCLGLIAARDAAAQARMATLYKDPDCECCGAYGAYLREHGFQVSLVETRDLALMNLRHGVVPGLEGCHLTVIDRYAIGGHVPIGPINRLLAERPAIPGITLPGMPLGSPGMHGPKVGPFTVYEIGGIPPRVYAIE